MQMGTFQERNAVVDRSSSKDDFGDSILSISVDGKCLNLKCKLNNEVRD